MDKTPEERLRYLEGMALTHSLVLHTLIGKTWRIEKQRELARELIVGGILANYSASGIKPHGHDAYRAAVQEAESLFQFGETVPKADPS